MGFFIIALALFPIGLIAALAGGAGRGIMLIAYGSVLFCTYALAHVIARLLWIAAQKRRIERAKDEFVSFASHQLRTPLTTMNWRLEMLRSGDAGKLSKSQELYISEIEDETRRMTELVNTFLNVSRISLGTLSISTKPCDVSAVIAGVLEEFARDLKEKHIRVRRDLSIDLTIQCDPSMVRMALQNLISNAVKYTHDGGAITIGGKRTGTDLVITVSDTGIGIPKAAHDHIFTRLFRAENARKEQPDGTGIGLYIVKSLLDSVGGRVWFESSEGSGSTFSIALPARGIRAKAGSTALSFARR